MNLTPSILQHYTPTEHTGELLIEEYRECRQNDGWVHTIYRVYLVDREGLVDWVEDFTSLAAAEAFVRGVKAEITQPKGNA